MRWGRDLNPRRAFTLTAFRERRFQPLSHPTTTLNLQYLTDKIKVIKKHPFG